jgi:hypothetical protein
MLFVLAAEEAKAAAPSPDAAWLQIFLKLLDWPFLLCLFLVLLVMFFRKQFVVLLGRGVTIEWEKLKVELGKVVEKEVKQKLEQDLDPLRDEVDAVKAQTLAVPPAADVGGRAPPPPPNQLTAKDRIKRALQDPRYKWRSVERLSYLAGVPEKEALDIVRADDDIVLGKGVSGRQIARLKSRE